MKTRHKHWAVLTASTLGLTALVSAANLGGEKYTYDGSGNIVEKSIDGQVTKMSYDASNKITSIVSADNGREQISNDAAGRPVSYNDASGQFSRQLSYGYADKVLQANSSSGKAEFFYNAEGQLVGKSVAGKLTPYSWDGNVIATEGADAFTNEAHITGGVPALTGDQSIVVSDYLGSTLSQGNQLFTGTAYGEGLESARLTGKPYIEELKAYVFHHRNYSPVSACWTMADPSGFPDGTNSSTYVKNNPLSGVDPKGLVTYSDGNSSAITTGLTGYDTPKKVAGSGTIKVIEVDKGSGNRCYRPVVDKPFAFTAGSNIILPTLGGVLELHTFDSKFVGTSTTHETWHRDIFTTMVNQTFGALETWSSSYVGNEYGTPEEAMTVGLFDFNTTFENAVDTANGAWSSFRLSGHPSKGAEKAVEGGVNVWRSINPNWGGNAQALMTALSYTKYTTLGTCEY
jgi:RHS repeat-associated protein